MGERQSSYVINTDYYGKLTPQQMMFILNQSEKALNDTHDIGNNVVQKTTTVTTLIVGLLVSITGYLIADYGKMSPATKLTLILCLPYIYVMLFFLARNLKGVKYHLKGRQPNELMKNIDLEKYEGNELDAALIFREIDANQIRIQENTVINESRWALFNKTLIALVILPIYAIAVYAIVLLLALCPCGCQSH